MLVEVGGMAEASIVEDSHAEDSHAEDSHEDLHADLHAEDFQVADLGHDVPMAQQEQSCSSGSPCKDEGKPRVSKASDVGHRLHANAHVCNHARCAANNPHYAVKAPTPPKKFLVAKKHVYGGLNLTGDKKSSSLDQQRSSALNSLTNLQTKDRRTRSTSSLRVSDSERRLHDVASSGPQRNHRGGSSESTKVAGERKGKPSSSLSFGRVESSTARRSNVFAESSTPKDRWQKKSQLRDPNGGPKSTTVEVPLKKISFSIVASATQVTISSPTASVGSNDDDIEVPSLKESVQILESELFGLSHEPTTPRSSDLQSPVSESLSSILVQSSPTWETNFDSPVSSEATHLPESSSLSISSILSGPSQSFTSTTLGASILTLNTVDESPHSNLQKNVVEVGTSFDSNFSPSAHSMASISELSASTKSKPSSSSAPTTPESSFVGGSPAPAEASNETLQSPSSATPAPKSCSLTINSSSSTSSKLVGRFVKNLRESAKASAALAAAATSAKKVSSNTSTLVESSSIHPTSGASKLPKKFDANFQSSSPPRKVAPSSKGVRAVELRGGKAQTFSATTVTSWNAANTTVETSLSISDSSPEESVDSEVSKPESSATSLRDTLTSSTTVTSTTEETVDSEVSKLVPSATSVKDTRTALSTASSKVSNDDPGAVPKIRKKVRDPTALFDEMQAESETVALKHGEVAERRLSEEWMTNHALEGVQKTIADKERRVKVLVHAFETLSTLDTEALANEENNLKTQLDFEAISTTLLEVQ